MKDHICTSPGALEIFVQAFILSHCELAVDSHTVISLITFSRALLLAAAGLIPGNMFEGGISGAPGLLRQFSHAQSLGSQSKPF